MEIHYKSLDDKWIMRRQADSWHQKVQTYTLMTLPNNYIYLRTNILKKEREGVSESSYQLTFFLEASFGVPYPHNIWSPKTSA